MKSSLAWLLHKSLTLHTLSLCVYVCMHASSLRVRAFGVSFVNDGFAKVL